jgi:hypothetical protein
MKYQSITEFYNNTLEVLNELTIISPIQGKWYLLWPSHRPTQQSFRDRLVDFVLTTQHCSEHSEASRKMMNSIYNLNLLTTNVQVNLRKKNQENSYPNQKKKAAVHACVTAFAFAICFLVKQV